MGWCKDRVLQSFSRMAIYGQLTTRARHDATGRPRLRELASCRGVGRCELATAFIVSHVVAWSAGRHVVDAAVPVLPWTTRLHHVQAASAAAADTPAGRPSVDE